MSSNARPPWPDDEQSRRARALLDDVRRAGPSPERLAEIERGLARRLDGGSTPSGGVPRVAVIVGAVVVLAVAGMLAWRPWATPDAPVVAPRAAPGVVQPPSAGANAHPPPASVAAEAQPEGERPLPAQARPERSRPASPRAAAASGGEGSAPEDEATLVDDARAALRSGDAPRALALVRRHERSFSSGELVEEREVVAVEALAATGARAQARDRATRFLARWPGSPYALRVRAVIAAGSEKNGRP